MDKRKIYCVYIHLLKTNPRKGYVGKGKQQYESDGTTLHRWRSNGIEYLTKHKNGKYKQEHFAKAIKKYGWNAFEHRILLSNLDEEDALKHERLLISFLKYMGYELYNISPGGEGNGSGPEHPAYKDGRSYNKKQYSKDYAKAHPEEKKASQRKSLAKTRPIKIEHMLNGELEFMPKAQRHPVICVETGVVYDSPTEAAWLLKIPSAGIDGGKIRDTCNSKQHTCMGYHWKWVKEE